MAGLGIGGSIASRVWGREVGPLLAIHVLTVTWGYLAALAAGALAVWVVADGAYRGDGRRGMAAFRRPASGLAWASLSMTAVGVVLGAVWASGRMGRAWNWDSREVGGLGVLLCAGLFAVVIRLNARAGIAAAITGSTAVVLAWFVPPLLETDGASGVGLGAGRAARCRVTCSHVGRERSGVRLGNPPLGLLEGVRARPGGRRVKHQEPGAGPPAAAEPDGAPNSGREVR